MPGGAALVPLWIPSPTPQSAIGRVREAVTAEGLQATFAVISEAYDATTRSRTTRTRYGLEDRHGRRELDRDWVLHWYTEHGFERLAAGAGLTIESVVESNTDEQVVLLRRDQRAQSPRNWTTS